MAGKSDYLSKKVLKKALRNEDFTAPATYLALFTTLPTDANAGGVEVSEVLTGYARQPIAFTDASTPQVGTNQCVNTADVAFAQALLAWGVIVGYGIFDALVAGNPLYLDLLGTYDEAGAFTAVPKQIDAGDEFFVPAGTLVVQEK